MGVTNFCLQKGCLTFFLCQAMEGFCKLEHSLKVRVCFLEHHLASDTVAGSCVAVGLGAVLGLNLLGTALFLFSMSFLTLGLVSGSQGLNSLAGIGPICPSPSSKIFIFLIILGWGQSLVFHGVHLINWVIQSCLNMCVPCMDVIFTSTSTTSTRSLHLK